MVSTLWDLSKGAVLVQARWGAESTTFLASEDLLLAGMLDALRMFVKTMLIDLWSEWLAESTVGGECPATAAGRLCKVMVFAKNLFFSWIREIKETAILSCSNHREQLVIQLMISLYDPNNKGKNPWIGLNQKSDQWIYSQESQEMDLFLYKWRSWWKIKLVWEDTVLFSSLEMSMSCRVMSLASERHDMSFTKCPRHVSVTCCHNGIMEWWWMS